MCTAFANIDLKIGSNLPGDEPMARNTSEIERSCSRASFNSRIMPGLAPRTPAAETAGSRCAVECFDLAALRPRALADLLLTLERLFIGSPVVQEQSS